MASGNDDAQLMTRYATGDAAAFEALYARHKGPLYRYFYRQFGNPDTVDELFQDVWARIIKLRDRGDAKSAFTTHLYRIAHTCLVEHFRKAGRSLADGAPAAPASSPAGAFPDPTAEEVDPAFASARWSLVDWEQGPADASSGPEITNSIEGRASRLQAALDGLPAEQREVFLLHEEPRLGLAEIAAVTGASGEAVMNHLRNVVNSLRRALGDLAPAAARGNLE